MYLGILELIKITQKYGYQSSMTSLKAYRKQKERFVKSFQLDGYGITMDIKKNKPILSIVWAFIFCP